MMGMRALTGILTLALAMALAPLAMATEPELLDLEVGAGGSVTLARGNNPNTRLPTRLRLELERISPALGGVEPGLTVRRRTKKHGSEFIKFEVGKLPAGVYHVRERLKGGAFGRDFRNFAVQPPQIFEPDVIPFRAGDIISLGGSFFGPRFAKVRAGKKRLRIQRRPSQGRVRVKLPRNLADGDYPLTIETPAGMVTAIAPLRIATGLHDLSTRDLQPTVELGMDTERGISRHHIFVRPRDPGLMEFVLGDFDSRRGFIRLTFAVPDVFDESLELPTTVRAEWAVMQQRANDAERESTPDSWYREEGLVVTVLAFDAPSGFVVAEFTGGLERVDEFGTPIDGSTVQFRGGRVEAFIRREPPPPINSQLELEFDQPGILDVDTSTATVYGSRLEPIPEHYENAVGVTRFFDVGVDDPVFSTPSPSDLRLYAPTGSAILFEVQAAPAIQPKVPVLSAIADEAAASEWLPVYLFDQQGTPEGAFADLGFTRFDIGFEEYFPLDDLSGHGYRLVRYRITLRMLEPPYIGPSVRGPIPNADEINLPFTHTDPR